MRKAITKLGSVKLTAVFMLPLIATVLLINQLESFSSNWVAVPLSLLAINLTAAILTNAAFRRQPALLAFHVLLFGVIVLWGAGALLQYDGHVELVEGEAFDARNVEVTDIGWLRKKRPESVRFTQGPIAVEYTASLIRQSTFSEVLLGEDESYTSALRFGDRASMEIDGYRFSTSFNKGFAAVLQWSGANGEALLGTINFPSYPEYEWKQVNDWVTPGGERIIVNLLLPGPAKRDGKWRLQSSGPRFSIVVSRPDGTTRQLEEGDSLKLRGGVLTVRDLRMWMGYRIDANPMLLWALLSALLCVAALALHFGNKYWRVGERTHIRRRQRVCVSTI